jgi:hypothetical protein
VISSPGRLADYTRAVSPDELAALAATARDDDSSSGANHPGAPAGVVGGRYVFERLLGSGGMGVVFAARDQLLDRPVALKVLRSQADTQADARLMREARAMAQLSHPNVLQVFDVGVAENGPIYVATELVEGMTLERWLAERSPDAAAIVEAFCAAGRGLAAAHAAGIVHRDFKPDNVMVGNDGRVRVLDFGLARPGAAVEQALAEPEVGVDAPTGLTMTVTGAVVGTPRYMSPEQWRGEATDARTDQFSFCVALAAALGGLHPFDDSSPVALRAALLAGTPPLLPASLPARIAAVLRRGLAHRPGDRFATMDGLVRALEPRPPSRRLWWIAAALALVAAAIVVAGLAVRRSRLQAITTQSAVAEIAVGLVGFRCGANYQTYAVEAGDSRGVRCVRFADTTPWIIWYGEGVGPRGRYRELGEGRLGGDAVAAGFAGNGEEDTALRTLALRPSDARVIPARIDVVGERAETWIRTAGWHGGYTSGLRAPIRVCGPHLRRYHVFAKDERVTGSAVACVTPSGATWLTTGAWGGVYARYLGTTGFGDGTMGFNANICVPGLWCGVDREGRVGRSRLRRRQLPGVGEIMDFSKGFPELWFPWQRRHALRLHVVRVVDDASPDQLPVTVAEIEQAVRRVNQRLAADDVEVFFVADDAGPDVETLLRSALVDPTTVERAHPNKVVVVVAPGEPAWEEQLANALRRRVP